MYAFREDEELMADALRRAFRVRMEDDRRFADLLAKIREARRKAGSEKP